MSLRTAIDTSSGRAGARESQIYPSRFPSGERLSLVFLFLFTIFLRAVVTWQVSWLPTFDHLVGDAAGYWAWAGEIASGRWLGDQPFYQAPLYPYALAVVRWMGGGLTVARVMQIAWSAIGVLVVYGVTRRMFGRGAGLCSAMMMALYPPAIYFDGIIQKTSLGGLLTTVVMACVVRCAGGNAAWSLMSGVAVGLLCLVRENALLWIPLIALWRVMGGQRDPGEAIALPGLKIEGDPRVGGRIAGAPSRRSRAMGGIGVIVGSMIVLTPVAAFNFSRGGGWSPTTNQAGPNFFIGNGAGADGRYRPLVRGHETPRFERDDAGRLAEEAIGRPLSPAEVSRFWFGRSWRDVGDDPLRWLKLMGYKLLLTLNEYEIADAESLYVHAAASPVLGVMTRTWHFGFLAALSAAGIVATWRGRRAPWIIHAMIAVMVAAVTLFYVSARYRFPLVPLLMPLAGAGLLALVDGVRRRAWRGLAGPVLAAALTGLVCHLPVQDESRLTAMAWMNVGVAAAEQGDLNTASGYFQEAYDRFPESIEINVNLGTVLSMLGADDRAVRHLGEALNRAPELVDARFNLALSLERSGRVQEARREYERVLADRRDDDEARAALVRLEAGSSGP